MGALHAAFALLVALFVAAPPLPVSSVPVWFEWTRDLDVPGLALTAPTENFAGPNATYIYQLRVKIGSVVPGPTSQVFYGDMRAASGTTTSLFCFQSGTSITSVGGPVGSLRCYGPQRSPSVTVTMTLSQYRVITVVYTPTQSALFLDGESLGVDSVSNTDVTQFAAFRLGQQYGGGFPMPSGSEITYMIITRDPNDVSTSGGRLDLDDLSKDFIPNQPSSTQWAPAYLFGQGPTATVEADKTATVTAEVNEQGTMHCCALPSPSSAPASCATVVDETLAGAAACASGASGSASPFGMTLSLSVGGAVGAYDVYCCTEDPSGNWLAEPAVAGTSLALGANEPPAFAAAPSPSVDAEGVATVSAELDEQGSLHCCAVESPATPPGSCAEIVSGTLAGAAACADGAASAASAPFGVEAGPLSVGFAVGDYDLLCCARDAELTEQAAPSAEAALQGVRLGQCAPLDPSPVLVTAGPSEPADASPATFEWSAAGSAAYAEALSFRWQGASELCDSAYTGGDAVGAWQVTDSADGCTSGVTFAADEWPAVLPACNFAAVDPQPDPAFTAFAATIESAVNPTVANANTTFGDGTTRTTQTSFTVRVRFPAATAVNGAAESFGAVIEQAALSEQTFNSLTQEFRWTLATSVQHPYYLAPAESSPTGVAGHVFDALPTVAAQGDRNCSEAGTAACTQKFALAATESNECSVTGATVTVAFQILCRPQYTGSCDTPAGDPPTASFTVETDNFCPQVVEVASVTPALTTYSDSDRTSVSTNYILETTLFARVTADVEAGLRAQRTTLTGLDIVSSCTGCTPLVQPFPDTSAAAAAYDFQYVSGGTDNSATGEVETDFSFTLNTNSLSFDGDSSTGEAQITLTAYVTVQYDTPSQQGLERSYRVQVVSGPGSIGSSATAQASVSGVPAGPAGGSSSTAGSTVLGVSTGTAALAAAGLAAVAALSVGAAVAARRRRRARGSEQRVKAATPFSFSSSSSSSVVLRAPVATSSTEPERVSLSTVQAQYDAVLSV